MKFKDVQLELKAQKIWDKYEKKYQDLLNDLTELRNCIIDLNELPDLADRLEENDILKFDKVKNISDNLVNLLQNDVEIKEK